jgi:hypothetical protein
MKLELLKQEEVSGEIWYIVSTGEGIGQQRYFAVKEQAQQFYEQIKTNAMSGKVFPFSETLESFDTEKTEDDE